MRPRSTRALVTASFVMLASCDNAPPVASSEFLSHDGVRLHYVDWRSDNPPVVLLPGYTLTAHAFREIGDSLATDFRVIAVTPRGFGESDAPDSSEYTTATMVEDLRVLLDSLGIERAAFVGHSFSGVTISAFAIKYPDRVSRLIYLDSHPYFLELGGDTLARLDPAPEPAFEGDTTYERIAEHLRTYRFGGWSNPLEADLRSNTLGADLARRRELTLGYLYDQRPNAPDMRQINAPALQLCAIPTVATEYGWLTAGSPEHANAERYVSDILQPFTRQLCDHFKQVVPGGQAIELSASHYWFFVHPDSTVGYIRDFLSEADPGHSADSAQSIR